MQWFATNKFTVIMSKALYLFAVSFLIWIPLAYIFFHSYDQVESDVHPLQLSTKATAVTTLPDQSAVRLYSPSHVAALPGATIISTQAQEGKVRSPTVKSSSPLLHKVPALQLGSNKSRTANDFKVPGGMSWREFIDSKYVPPREGSFSIRPDVDLIQCSAAVEETLQKPGLSPADFKWCEWALSSSGGKVQVRIYPTC
jgi:hypothetical protein